MTALFLVEIEREQGAAISLFDKSFGTTANEPSNLDAVFLSQAFQLDMLLASQSGRHANRVFPILSHSILLLRSAALRGYYHFA